MGGSPNPNIDRVKLRDLLLKHAVSDDLRNFCFELGETYENIVGPNDKLNAAIINVITYFDSRGRAGDLVDRARAAFPRVAWQDVFVVRGSIGGSLDVSLEPVTLHASATVARRPGPLRVFLCHASDDKPAVRELYGQLKGAGFAPWLDEEDLLPGQRWRTEIPKAIERSDVILVCLSQKSANREGYVKREIEFALDIAEKQPDDASFVIPVRLEACDFPERVGDFHGVNLFDPRALERLTRALQARAAALGVEAASPRPARVEVLAPELPVAPARAADPLVIELPALNFRLELVRVPAGEFLMGSDKTQDAMASDAETPQQRVHLDDYLIGKYPVTNLHYGTYASAKGIAFKVPSEKEQHPVVNVTWEDALAFCAWLSEASGRSVSLPTEAQWEKAARWDAAKQHARLWPWGDAFDSSKANTSDAGIGTTTPVGAYSAKGGDSPYGCADMAGNVWEWCADWFDGGEYRQRPKTGVRNPTGPNQGVVRVLRGGSFDHYLGGARCADRNWTLPDLWSSGIGFRVMVRSAPVP